MIENNLILNRLFTQNVFLGMIQSSASNNTTYGAVIKRFIDEPEDKNNGALISEIYRFMSKSYRNEYFYQNTLLNKLLLGRHSVNTTTALTQIPISKSKADFILINGRAVVYEIKTELDNLERLESQINDYFKAFDHVAVVTYNENVTAIQKKIDSIGKPVGIYVLQNRGTIKTIQKPEKYRDALDSKIIYKILRKPEYEEIILNKYGFLPNVSAFEYYSECRKLFEKMPIEESYEWVLKLLKKRTKIIKNEYKEIPYELKFLAYFMDLKSEDYEKIRWFLNQAYGGV